jgi:fructokinase
MVSPPNDINRALQNRHAGFAESFRFTLRGSITIVVFNPINQELLVMQVSSQSSILALTMGEALIDLIGQETGGSFVAHSGGAVYNLARALAAQDLRSVYSNPLSNDRFGQQLREGLSHYKVELGSPIPVSQPTSLAVASLDSTGQAKYAFYREGVADKAITADRLKSISAHFFTRNQNNWALTGCLALAPDFIETTLVWLTKCKTLGATIAIDVNLRPVVVADSAAYRNAVMRSLAFADVIKASDEDLQWLFNNQLSATENGQILLKKTTAKLLAITCGSEGAYLTARNTTQRVESAPSAQAPSKQAYQPANQSVALQTRPKTLVELGQQTIYARDNAQFTVVDTVGAGDCFFAGLVAYVAPLLNSAITLAQLNAEQLEGALCRAIATASLNVQQAGCQPPSRASVDAWLAQHSIHIAFT